MSQPTGQHRREIWASLCISYDAVSGLLWQQAIDACQPVGTCGNCGGLMKPRPGEEHGRRMHYEAACMCCHRVVEGLGPRPPKKGAA